MNVCQLVDALEHAVERNGPLSEVVITTKHDQRYFNFMVNEWTRLIVSEGDENIITLELTDEVSTYVVPMEE